MKKLLQITVLGLSFVLNIANASEQKYTVESIIKLMNAYEEQLDSFKLEYEYIGYADTQGSREFEEGSFARKASEGYVLNDFIKYAGKTYDDKKYVEGIGAAFNGQSTWYLEHEKNKNGYYMGAVFDGLVGNHFKSFNNPHYRIWYFNYKNKFSDNLANPEGKAKIQKTELIDGVETIQINYKAASGFYDCNIWVSPERNFMPIKYEHYRTDTGELSWTTKWENFKKLSNGMWYPMRIAMTGKDAANPAVITVKRMDVTPLSKDDFVIKFPEFTHVTDHVAGISYVTTQPTTSSVDFDNINNEAINGNIDSRKKESILDMYAGGQAIAKTKQDINSVHEETLQVAENQANVNNNRNKALYIGLALLVLSCLVVVVGVIINKGKK
jgi:hypothetical protein